jgi:hypothetical protein
MRKNSGTMLASICLLFFINVIIGCATNRTPLPKGYDIIIVTPIYVYVPTLTPGQTPIGLPEGAPLYPFVSLDMVPNYNDYIYSGFKNFHTNTSSSQCDTMIGVWVKVQSNASFVNPPQTGSNKIKIRILPQNPNSTATLVAPTDGYVDDGTCSLLNYANISPQNCVATQVPNAQKPAGTNINFTQAYVELGVYALGYICQSADKQNWYEVYYSLYPGPHAFNIYGMSDADWNDFLKDYNLTQDTSNSNFCIGYNVTPPTLTLTLTLTPTPPPAGSTPTFTLTFTPTITPTFTPNANPVFTDFTLTFNSDILYADGGLSFAGFDTLKAHLSNSGSPVPYALIKINVTGTPTPETGTEAHILNWQGTPVTQLITDQNGDAYFYFNSNSNETGPSIYNLYLICGGQYNSHTYYTYNTYPFYDFVESNYFLDSTGAIDAAAIENWFSTLTSGGNVDCRLQNLEIADINALIEPKINGTPISHTVAEWIPIAMNYVNADVSAAVIITLAQKESGAVFLDPTKYPAPTDVINFLNSADVFGTTPPNPAFVNQLVRAINSIQNDYDSVRSSSNVFWNFNLKNRPGKFVYTHNDTPHTNLTSAHINLTTPYAYALFDYDPEINSAWNNGGNETFWELWSPVGNDFRYAGQ